MYHLSHYEWLEMNFGHMTALVMMQEYVGPGFANAVNRFYEYRVWR